MVSLNFFTDPFFPSNKLCIDSTRGVLVSDSQYELGFVICLGQCEESIKLVNSQCCVNNYLAGKLLP